VRFGFDPLKNLFAMHGNIFGGADANADMWAFHSNHHDGDARANHYGFANATRENQHVGTLRGYAGRL
jgi:hypothetical protein